MDLSKKINIIAKIQNDFHSKFGIPRQSSFLSNFNSIIVFEKEFQDVNALRGLEGFSHIWLLWLFSENEHTNWTPTVRPPKLGGNQRLGVFATRSPFRPSPIGMSAVRLHKINLNGVNGPELLISGADLVNGTPILDIKPYIPYADSIPSASGGFLETLENKPLKVTFEKNCHEIISKEKQKQLIEILSLDPRPGYHDKENRIYGFKFSNYEIKFSVHDSVLSVINIEELK